MSEARLASSYGMFVPEQRPEEGGQGGGQQNGPCLCGKSSDFPTFTLRMKLSMNPVYELMCSR
jgi:hypothetical protein